MKTSAFFNLDELTEPERQDYVRAICKHMDVPYELNLVGLSYLDEDEGPRRLVPYAKRGATEIVRNNRGISVTTLTHEMVGGSIVYTATGKDKDGRQEISSGSKYIHGLLGKELDDAIMTAQTRACRRMTLQFVGAGVLDESEVNPALRVKITQTAEAPVQPTVAPANEPGKDITVQPSPVAEETPEQFKVRMDKMRADAIASLNASLNASSAPPATAKQEQGAVGNGLCVSPAPAEIKKTRKPRGPNKPKADMGPSAPAPVEPVKTPEITAPVMPTLQTGIASASGTVVQPMATAIIVSTPPPTLGKPRLTPEQVQPFRARLFKLQNEQLEPAGFAPKEGMGNMDKFRTFAKLMYPDVTNMYELSIEQWEKFLATLEQKVATVGAKATATYIEDAIGI